MWLGGVAQDVVGGVLCFFWVLCISHIRSRILQIQLECWKENDTISCYLGSIMLV